MRNHRDEVLRLLRTQISSAEEVADISNTATEVASNWVNPLSGGKGSTNGLIYGLVQSGKTGVLTVTGAIGADEGYKAIIVLTSDIDPLYDQTLGRIQEAFPGIDILGKKDFKDAESFMQRIRRGNCVLVATKNGAILTTLIQNFRAGNVRGLTCLIIDDEADQASLNTRAKKNDGTQSKINDLISQLRAFFDKNTYLQVTATPQSIFLQAPTHAFRPKFTVLSHPGADYVGGDDFFCDDSRLVEEFEIHDIHVLAPGAQPAASLTLPASLIRALDTFMVGATFKRLQDPSQNCAFLCHVSTRNSDHQHIVELLRKYKGDLTSALKSKNQRAISRLREAFESLARTHEGVRGARFEELIEAIEFYSPGITVKMVNGQTDEDVAVRSPYNLFVGGNKLGRGVTIKNLLVSYYGRNPRNPQADTVLQHARMYGYRRKDIGLLRLFLPPELNAVFQAINKMERGLRDLIASRPSEEFRGLYVESGVSPTRKNVLAPGSIGVYAGGSTYNPANVVRDAGARGATTEIDAILKDIPSKTHAVMPLETLRKLVSLTIPDVAASERIWSPIAVGESLVKFGRLHDQHEGYVYVDRGRGLKENRRETQGILDGGEQAKVPRDKVTLFLLRTSSEAGKSEAWWPQVRFPDGRYAFAFAI